MSERDAAWRRVFEALPADSRLARDGIFHVTADELKAHGRREPRLMAKIDTLAERPAPLAERGLALFPVRNGRYVLFPDPGDRSFHRFAREDHMVPARVHRSTADLRAYDTYPRGREGSESQALDFAHLSGLLEAFCGEEDLRLTLRGRFFSGDFGFPTPAGGKVEVSRVQIEVDAGYEGPESIVLVEAKRGRREDFHIRQLWYPYRHWNALSRKRVRPVFFAYSNGAYHLDEFAFGEGFGELEAVRSRAYLLDESPLADLDIPRRMEAVPCGPEPACAFPQADDLDKVADIVRMAEPENVTKEGIAGVFDFEERQGDYYANAACYLGLLGRVDGGFGITAEGRSFAALRSRAERTLRLVDRMLAVPSLREALALLASRDYRVEKIAPGELAALVRERSGLGAATLARRAVTLRSWLAWIMGNAKVRV
jgi:hypothetical protein